MKASNNSESNFIRYVAVITLYILLCIIDGIITYMYTPDLSMEANPAVTSLRLGWNGIFISNIIGILILAAFSVFPIIKYDRSPIDCDSFKDYVSKLYFNRSGCLRQIFKTKKHENKSVMPASLCHAVVTGAIVSRIYVIVQSIFYLNGISPCVFCFANVSHTYCNMITYTTDKGTQFIPIVMLAVVGTVSLSSCILWHYKEYRINQRLRRSRKCAG